MPLAGEVLGARMVRLLSNSISMDYRNDKTQFKYIFRIFFRQMFTKNCLLFFFAAFNWSIATSAQQRPTLQEFSEHYFSTLNPCAIYDFTLPQELTKSFQFNFHEPLTVQQVEQLADEFSWGGRYAMLFYPRPTTNRYQSEKSFFRLAEMMKRFQFSQIVLSEIRPFALAKLDEIKSQGTIGECYPIQTKETPLIAAARTVAISSTVQNQMDALFRSQSSVKAVALSDNERSLMDNRILNNEEIMELRAIRTATKIFESHTILRLDLAGGIWTNLKGELLGQNQLACTEEAETYELFLKVLNARGLLRYFKGDGQISMRPGFLKDWSQGGHVATRLVNLRSRQIFVLDSWYEKGGEAAHILLEDDWRQLPVSSISKINFKDVVEFVP